MRPATTRTVLSAFALAATTMSALAQAPTADNLASRQVQRRAVEAVIWGMPAVNFDLMLQAALKAGAKENQIGPGSRLNHRLGIGLPAVARAYGSSREGFLIQGFSRAHG